MYGMKLMRNCENILERVAHVIAGGYLAGMTVFQSARTPVLDSL